VRAGQVPRRVDQHDVRERLREIPDETACRGIVIGGDVARRHAVDDAHGALLGLELGFEDERMPAVAAARAPNLTCGASCQQSCVSSPSSAAKQAPESKRGSGSQSIDPCRLTRAAVCVSPMSA
jgi:hypothetical protein